MSDPADNKRIEDSTVNSHPFKAHYHGTETGDPGYLAIESGYIIPGGFFKGFEAILPTFAGASLQDQHHTGELTHIVNPAIGDYYIEATGEWRTTGMDGDTRIEMFEPHTAEVKHHGQLMLTDEKKRALKVFRLESDGRVTQYIKSDIPMSLGRPVEAPPPEPPGPGDGSGSGPSSRSSSSSAPPMPGSGSGSGSLPPGIIPFYDAGFIEQWYIPDIIYPGSTSNVQLRFRNDGNDTGIWYPGFQKLLPQGYDWGLFEVPMPAVTYPGVTREFNFPITAPMTVGTYSFQWQMYGSGLFGDLSPEVDIHVVAPPVTVSSSSSSAGPPLIVPFSSSAFTNWFVIPDVVETEETLWLQIIMRNVGNTTWYPGVHKLVPIGHDWGVFEIPLATETLPGAERTFDVECYAPTTPGMYDFQWQMAGPSGVFGGQTPNKSIAVVPRTTPPMPTTSSSSSSSAPPIPPIPPSSSSGSGPIGVSSANATFVNQFPIPTTIVAGSQADLQITMRNVGATTWTSGQHRLATKTPDFNTFWGMSYKMVPNTVYPGVERTFYLTITAPATTGNYPFRWQMNDGTNFFGALTPDVIIGVVTASPSSSSS